MRLSDADCSVLLAQLRGVLTIQEREDLRAAMKRPPIIQLVSPGMMD